MINVDKERGPGIREVITKVIHDFEMAYSCQPQFIAMNTPMKMRLLAYFREFYPDAPFLVHPNLPITFGGLPVVVNEEVEDDRVEVGKHLTKRSDQLSDDVEINFGLNRRNNG